MEGNAQIIIVFATKTVAVDMNQYLAKSMQSLEGNLKQMTKTERAFFRVAQNISTLSDHRQKLGCAVVYKHRVISTGYNSHTKCHSLQARLDKERYGQDTPGRLHAETAALLPFIQNNINLSGASIYIYRQHKDGSLAISKPCPSCMKLIKRCGIRRIYYSSDDGYVREDLEL